MRRHLPAARCIWASPRWSPAMCCPTCSPATAAPTPMSTVSAIEDNGDYLEHLLIGGELDVAVMVISNLRDRVALQAEIFETSPYRLWLPLGHRLAGADIISISDIVPEPLIMLTVDETEENTGKLLSAFSRQAARRLPHPLGRGGAQPRRHRRRHRAAARSRLSAVVAGRRPDREPRRFRRSAGGAGRHGLAPRQPADAGGARFHRHGCRMSRPATSSGMAHSGAWWMARQRPMDPAGIGTGFRYFRYLPSAE